MLLERTTFVPAPIERVFDFFSDPRNLARLTPSSLGFTILSAPGRALQQGDEIEYRIRAFPYHDLLTHRFEMGMMVWL